MTKEPISTEHWHQSRKKALQIEGQSLIGNREKMWGGKPTHMRFQINPGILWKIRIESILLAHGGKKNLSVFYTWLVTLW